jgi:hypothetical protein
LSTYLKIESRILACLLGIAALVGPFILALFISQTFLPFRPDDYGDGHFLVPCVYIAVYAVSYRMYKLFERDIQEAYRKNL